MKKDLQEYIDGRRQNGKTIYTCAHLETEDARVAEVLPLGKDRSVIICQSCSDSIALDALKHFLKDAHISVEMSHA